MRLRGVGWALLVFFALDAYADMSHWSRDLPWLSWPWCALALVRGVIVVGALDLWHYKVKQGTV